MTNISKKIWLSALCFAAILTLHISNAHAFVKLDFTGPVADVVDKIKQEAIKAEELYKSQLEKLNQKIMKAYGQEGADLFRHITGNTSAIITSAAKGQYNAGDFTARGFIDAISRDLANQQIDYATFYQRLEDYVSAQEQAKLDRKVAMEEELMKLASQRTALNDLIAQNPNDETTDKRKMELDELDKAIASLRTQIKENDEQQIIDDPNKKLLETQLQKYQKQIGKLQENISADNVMGKLQLEAANLFEHGFGHRDNAEDESNTEIYKTALSRLFLAEDEVENTETVARIMKARKREYYDALKNSLETVVTTYGSIVEISERSKACAEASTKMANGVFGASAMRICTELQNAKVAARYMEILLALIRYETTAEMQMWTNKYKLKDYEKDVTKFNLDDYVMKKESLLKKAKAKAQNALDKKINSLIGL